MEPLKWRPPPLILYLFVMLDFPAWLIIFLDALDEPVSWIDAAIPVSLLAFVGYSIVSLLFYINGISIITLIIWVPISAFLAFVSLLVVQLGLSTASPDWIGRALVVMPLQCAAALLFFRRSLISWLISGGYYDPDEGAFGEDLSGEEGEELLEEQAEGVIVALAAPEKPSHT